MPPVQKKKKNYKRNTEDYTFSPIAVTKEDLKKICNEMFPGEDFSIQYARLKKYDGELFDFNDSTVYRELHKYLPKSVYDEDSEDEEEGEEISLDEFVHRAVDGDVAAMVVVGNLMELTEEYEDAIKVYKDAAKQNNE